MLLSGHHHCYLPLSFCHSAVPPFGREAVALITGRDPSLVNDNPSIIISKLNVAIVLDQMLDLLDDYFV